MSRTASWLTQYLYSTNIKLLLIWAERPLESLSAFTVDQHFNSPYGPYGTYRITVPVQNKYSSPPSMDRKHFTIPHCL